MATNLDRQFKKKMTEKKQKRDKMIRMNQRCKLIRRGKKL